MREEKKTGEIQSRQAQGGGGKSILREGPALPGSLHLPAARPQTSIYVRWSEGFPFFPTSLDCSGEAEKGEGAKVPSIPSPGLPPAPLPCQGQTPSSRKPSSHHHTLLSAFPLCSRASLVPGRGPESRSCLSSDCKFLWLRENYPSSHPTHYSLPDGKRREPDGQVQRLVDVLQKLRVEGALGDDGRQPGSERQQLRGPGSREGHGD